MKKSVEERLRLLGIREGDLIERFVLGSGSGGQKINKTASSVYLKHLPTGIEVKCQMSRSREENRQEARRLLCMKLEERQKREEQAKLALAAKLKRQKRKRSFKQKEILLETKRRRSQKKRLRGRFTGDS